MKRVAANQINFFQYKKIKKLKFPFLIFKKMLNCTKIEIINI